MDITFSELQDPKSWDSGWQIIDCPTCNRKGCKDCQYTGYLKISKKPFASLN